MSKAAKEMFEELGYKDVKSVNNVYIIYSNTPISILFDIRYKKVSKNWFDNSSLCASMEFEHNEIKAIHQQMIELGWLDNE